MLRTVRLDGAGGQLAHDIADVVGVENFPDPAADAKAYRSGIFPAGERNEIMTESGFHGGYVVIGPPPGAGSP